MKKSGFRSGKNPLNLFNKWFKKAQSSGLKLPEAVVLSTAAKSGQPSSRLVLCKEVTTDGNFIFYTNYESRKGRELLENPRAALVFYWSALDLQIRIEGKVKKVSRQKSLEYFRSRPLGSQISAWISPQSKIVSKGRNWNGRKQMLKACENFGILIRKDKIFCPPFWGGFAVKAHQIEFWMNDPKRLHFRIVYKKIKNKWKTFEVAP